jgi:phage portal protein BeeE
MTLSAYYCGVKTIAYDLATLQLRMFKNRPDGGKDVIRGNPRSAPPAASADLAYRLSVQPNDQQSAAEYYAGQIAQFLLRGFAYAEIVDGPSGFLEQLLPRHPDRVLPGGCRAGHVVQADRSERPAAVSHPGGDARRARHLDRQRQRVLDVRTARTRSAPAWPPSARPAKFFKSGMTAATVATYKGEMDDEDEDKLHKSISRYAAGVENSFGLMLMPDDVTITNLGVEPEKAQMMLAREWTVFEVARQPADLAAEADGAGKGERLRIGVSGRHRPRRRLPAADRGVLRTGDAARRDPREGHLPAEVPPGRAAARRPRAARRTSSRS